MIASTVSRHRPQIQARFPGEGAFVADARDDEAESERYALWPKAGDPRSFDGPHYTAWYRAASGARRAGAARERSASGARDEAGPEAFWEILVVRGALDTRSPDGETKRIGAGGYLCGAFSDRAVGRMGATPDALWIAKRRAELPASARRRFRISDALHWFPYLHADGLLDANDTAYLLGNPLKEAEGSTAIVRFPVGSSVSSHFHDAPLFHEFIYLAGGHATPDGYYAPGDHVTSLPGCKEGPWLATYAPTEREWPAGWPRSSEPSALFPAVTPPFADPFGTPGYVTGLLFVHGGPFAQPNGEVSWTRLRPDELGPRG